MAKNGLYENKTYSLRIPDEMKEQIRQIADRKQMKMSKVYEEAIKEYIDRHKGDLV